MPAVELILALLRHRPGRNKDMGVPGQSQKLRRAQIPNVEAALFELICTCVCMYIHLYIHKNIYRYRYRYAYICIYI